MVTASTLLFLTPLQTLSAVDLRDPEISALIAKKLREFHDLDMPGTKSVSVWQRLR
jgi:choline/ethanolamine kinase